MGGKQLTDFQVLGVKVFEAGGCVGYVHIEYMMATFAQSLVRLRKLVAQNSTPTPLPSRKE
jgi:hypothetical protein